MLAMVDQSDASYPRVSGGDPDSHILYLALSMLSPRERG